MNRLNYTVKSFSLLTKRVLKGQSLPYHSKSFASVNEMTKTENKKYLHNGILNTAKGILKGECRLHWLK